MNRLRKQKLREMNTRDRASESTIIKLRDFILTKKDKKDKKK